MASPLVDGLKLARRERVFSFIVVTLLGMFRLLGLKPKVVGREHLPAEGGYVLAVSHFSYLDFALAGWVVWVETRRPIRYLATKASFEHWLTGPLMRGAKHVPVDRAAGASAFTEAVKAIQSGEPMGIFPEGRVSRSWELLEFKTGAVRLAAEAGVPLIPCTVWGSQRVVTKGRRVRLREAFRAPVTITVGVPITITLAEDVEVANARLRGIMTDMVHAQQDAFPIDGTGKWWQPARLGGSPVA